MRSPASPARAGESDPADLGERTIRPTQAGGAASSTRELVDLGGREPLMRDHRAAPLTVDMADAHSRGPAAPIDRPATR